MAVVSVDGGADSQQPRLLFWLHLSNELGELLLWQDCDGS